MEQFAPMSSSSAPPSASFSPWHDLDEAGTGLTVDAFITTLMSQVGNALRRTITLPYAEHFGLSVPEWRLLALLAPAGRMAFSELVTQSTSDKALVSRTLKLLDERGLVALQAEGPTPRKKVYCDITPAGLELHAQAIPIAQQRQAAAIRTLEPAERDAMYQALLKLRAYCAAAQGDPVPGTKGRTAGRDLTGMDI